jgi:hypothetical protein
MLETSLSQLVQSLNELTTEVTRQTSAIQALCSEMKIDVSSTHDKQQRSCSEHCNVLVTVCDIVLNQITRSNYDNDDLVQYLTEVRRLNCQLNPTTSMESEYRPSPPFSVDLKTPAV